MLDKKFYWCIVQDSDLSSINWGSETIVYNSASGETHQIDDFSANVLEHLQANQCTEEQLQKKICDVYPLEDSTKIKQLLTQVINNFDQIGLIDPQY